MKVENQKFTGTVGRKVTGWYSEGSSEVENQKFTRTVRGKVRGGRSEGSSKDGESEVH